MLTQISLTVPETELSAADTLGTHSVIELHRYSAYIHMSSNTVPSG